MIWPLGPAQSGLWEFWTGNTFLSCPWWDRPSSSPFPLSGTALCRHTSSSAPLYHQSSLASVFWEPLSTPPSSSLLPFQRFCIWHLISHTMFFIASDLGSFYFPPPLSLFSRTLLHGFRLSFWLPPSPFPHFSPSSASPSAPSLPLPASWCSPQRVFFWTRVLAHAFSERLWAF